MKHYVRFYSPGTFTAEMTVREVDSWNVEEAKRLAKDIVERHGAKPYGFKFFTDGKPININKSCMYYLGGTIYSLEEVKEKFPKEKILISNMEINNWDHVIENKNSYTAWLPFEEGDILLDMNDWGLEDELFEIDDEKEMV